MDTREKIIGVEALPRLFESGAWRAVAGLFDPLTLTQAERIAGIAETYPGGKLLAIVQPDPQSLLSADARAALVAALRHVDAVTVATSDTIKARNIAVFEDGEAERVRSEQFIAFVLRRQRAAEPVTEAQQR